MQLKFLKTTKHFRKGGIHINPNIFWLAFLGFALLISLLSIIFGFYLFKTINKKFSSDAANGATQSNTLDKARIDKALNYFSERQKKSDAILNSPSPVIDPSL